MRYPAAIWIGPTPNMNPGAMQRPIMGIVWHIQQGTEAGSESWLKDPRSQASAHFLNPKQGPLRQLVDTDDKAWAQMAGNSRWISVEHEGMSGELLTNSQIANDAHLFAWLHHLEGVPLQLTDDVNVGGLGWHGMGGAAWGSHPDCPGAPIVGQRQAALTLTQSFVTPPTPVHPPHEEQDMAFITKDPAGAGQFVVSSDLSHKRGLTQLVDYQALLAAGYPQVNLTEALFASIPEL